MPRLFLFLTFFAVLFFQCGKFITSPTPIVATIRLVTPQGNPIVGHELILTIQFQLALVQAQMVWGKIYFCVLLAYMPSI